MMSGGYQAGRENENLKLLGANDPHTRFNHGPSFASPGFTAF
jgi:hypothetical protein